MTDTDRSHRATPRATLITLVALLVVILLAILSPFGWNFLMPHFAAMIIDIWQGLVTVVQWVAANVLAPVLGQFA